MAITVCYSNDLKRVVKNVPVDYLTPYAAVRYALLQSGAPHEFDTVVWPLEYEGIVEMARQRGITNVVTHRALGTRLSG